MKSKALRVVLHVDDDPQMLRLVATHLAGRGIEVISLEDPSELFDRLIKSNSRVVLLDIDMPAHNGLDLLKRIKQDDAGIQVIMLTGHVTVMTVLETMQMGAEACIFKPLESFEPLDEAVDAAFEKISRWWLSLKSLSLPHHTSDGEPNPQLVGESGRTESRSTHNDRQ